ncbi:MAG: M56 family metallopeptidase [Hyphomonadaceae bacterium]|nr:M56 family metallopeptidase [Hyphomonadaceae bacterium]
MTDASQFLIANLALSAGILLVFLLRKPVRLAFGASQAYALWLLPLLAALASLLPPRIIEIVVPAGVPPVDIALPAPEDFASISRDTPVSMSLDPREIARMLWEIAPAIWVGGILLMILSLASSQARFMANVRLGKAGPAVVGLFRPRVITPSDFDIRFDENERDVILDHENVHLRRNDARINAFAALLRCLCWFNPLVHLAAHFLRIDQEMACDAAVIARRPQARRLYADALVKTQLAAHPLPLGCYWPPGADHPLTERIAMLKRKRPGQMRRRAGIALLVALAFGAGLAAWAAIPAQRQLVFERDYVAERQAALAQPAEQVPPPPTKLEAPKPALPPAKPTLELPEVPKPAPFPARDAIEQVFPEARTSLPAEYDASTPVTLKGKIESVAVAPYAMSLTLTVKAIAIADGLGRDDQAFKPNTQTWRMPFGSANWVKAYTERAVGQEVTVRGYRAKDRTCNPDCLLYARDMNFHSADFFVPVPRPAPGPMPVPEKPHATALGKPVPAPPAGAPVQVLADRANGDNSGAVFTYEGNVQVRYNGHIFRSDKLTAEKRSPAGSDDFIESRADLITQNTETGVMTYEGNVEIRLREILLKADRLTSQSTSLGPLDDFPAVAGKPRAAPIPEAPRAVPAPPKPAAAPLEKPTRDNTPKTAPIPGGPIPSLQTLDRQPEVRRFEIQQVQPADSSAVGLANATHPVVTAQASIPDNSKYGVRLDPTQNSQAFHEGVDIRAARGVDTFAPAPATVTFAGVKGNYGRVVELRTEDGFLMRYGHLNEIKVSQGYKLKPGDVVGTMGATGRSTGPHLHFEISRNGRSVDPQLVGGLILTKR